VCVRLCVRASVCVIVCVCVCQINSVHSLSLFLSPLLSHPDHLQLVPITRNLPTMNWYCTELRQLETNKMYVLPATSLDPFNHFCSGKVLLYRSADIL